MQYIAYVFGIFGLVAYLELFGLKKRITALENELAHTRGTSLNEERRSLLELVRSCIGKKVKLELKEDYMDSDVISYGNTRHGSNTVLDADDDWLLVRIATPKGNKDKLLRMEAVMRITLAEE